MKSSGRRRRSLKGHSVTMRDFVAELVLLRYRADCVLRLGRGDLGAWQRADTDGSREEAIRVARLLDSVEASFRSIRLSLAR